MVKADFLNGLVTAWKGLKAVFREGVVKFTHVVNVNHSRPVSAVARGYLGNIRL